MTRVSDLIKTFSNPKTVKLMWQSRAIRPFRSIEGWLSLNEAFGLYTAARSLGAGATVVEIGSWKGKSTFCIAKGLSDGKVYAIDPFNADGEEGSKQVYESMAASSDLLAQFKENLSSRSVLDKVVPRKGYSKDFVNDFSSIDFLFIDGDHAVEGCKFDFDQYSPKLKVGGFLAFHDYDPLRKELGPWVVIENFVKKSGQYEEVAVYDTLWMGRKIR